MSFSLTSRDSRVFDLVQAAVRDVKQTLDKHPIEIRVPEDISARVWMRTVSREVLVQLLDTAPNIRLPNLLSGSPLS